ncbi:NAD-dependent epimerase/dehydratase family protein [Dissulfurispira sp.]|uniref:NAD-dependent epimerase/dehydratase family protein n=1 Tax=Dissulfurispira sp. TaxID=2817609 RepID=UPI002FDAABA5
MMAKILITGGAGFIGYFLIKKLLEANNSDITVIDNLSRGRVDTEFQQLLEHTNVRFINGDLTDPMLYTDLDRDYDYIYHLAGVIGVKHVMQNPDKVLYVNALSTLNIFEYAKKAKSLKKLFFSSTSEVYSGTMKHFGITVPTDEDVPLTIADIKADRTSYALSKMYGESIGFIYGRKYGIPVTVGRYHNVYGPRMGFAHVIPEMFVKITKNDIIDVASPAHTRAFCFVDDAIVLTILATESPDTINEIVNIGNSREEVSIKDLVLKIAEVLNKAITINELPDTPGSPQRRCPDTTKIEKLTGYTPVFSLEEGIRRTYDWYKDKLNVRYE